MKNTVAVISIVFFISLGYQCAEAATAIAGASATLETAVEISKDKENKISTTGGDLDFGTIVADAVEGTVLIDASDRQRYAKKKNVVGSNYGAAAFHVKGSKNKSHSIIIPDKGVIVTCNGNTMTVDAWNSNIEVGTLDEQGNSDFFVGGTLHVNSNQPEGTYTGTFPVAAAYN